MKLAGRGAVRGEGGTEMKNRVRQRKTLIQNSKETGKEKQRLTQAKWRGVGDADREGQGEKEGQ